MPQAGDARYCEEHNCEMHQLPSFSGTGLWVCPVCAQENEARLQAEEESRKVAARSRVISRKLEACQIGKRFRNVTFESYKPVNDKAGIIQQTCWHYACHFGEYLECGGGLILLGKPGTGKNHLAAAICTQVINSGHSALHTTVMKLIRRVRATWSSKSEDTEQQAILSFCEPDLLVIDEVGVQYGSDSEKLLLTEIINERYERLRPTIMISNLSVDALTETLGERIIDRFRDGGELLIFDWESYRKRQNRRA